MNAENKRILMTDGLGFSLIEVMISMGITLLVLAGAYSAFKSMTDVSYAANLSTEVGNNLQTAINLIRRDIQRTAKYIPNDGITLADGTKWNMVDPGATADAISMLIYPNNTRNKEITATNFVSVSNGSQIQVAAGNNISANSLLLVTDGTGYALLRVSSVTAGSPNDTVFFASNDDSGLNVLNSNNPATGMIAGGRSSLLVYPVRRVSFFKQQLQGVDWLMRQVDYDAPLRLIPGVSTLNITYDTSASDGNLTTNVAGTAIAAADRGSIRKVRLAIECRSEDQFSVGGSNRKYIANSLTTNIAVRRYRDRYPAASGN